MRDGADTRQLRVAVVGAGLVARVVHLPLLQRLSSLFRVEALAEPDPVARREVSRQFGVTRTYPDHCLLLEAGGIDAVVVCSPDATHAEVVLDALAAGAHTLVEKPLCLTVDEAERIVAARDRAGRVVQVGYMKRFDPAVEALLWDLGHAPVHIATATFDPGLREAFGMPPEPPRSVTDAFMGALVHDVNLVHAVLARCGLRVAGVVDAFADAAGPTAGGAIALEGGARWTAVWLALPGAGTFRERLALYGSDGVRELEFPAPYALHAPTVYRHTEATGEGSVETVRSSWLEAYQRQLEHFHACVTAGAPCRTPPEDAIADIALLTELMKQSR